MPADRRGASADAAAHDHHREHYEQQNHHHRGAAAAGGGDGRVAVVDEAGRVIILKDGKPFTGLEGAGPSIASAAASLSHLFVSGEDGFVTYDANSLNEVARFGWVGGGRHPPAIGPKGHVYAIASNILFVFPPPKLGASTVLQPQTNVTISTNPDPGPVTAQEKTYAPPLTTSGNRLFACEELDRTIVERATIRTSPSPGARSEDTRRSRTTPSMAGRAKPSHLTGVFAPRPNARCSIRSSATDPHDGPPNVLSKIDKGWGPSAAATMIGGQS
jgi:hypothetical protein